MATDPSWASTPRAAVAAVSTANTNMDGTGTIVDVFTAGSSGSKVNRIAVQATVNPADSVLTVFLYNGTSYFLFDTVDLGDPATSSTTVGGYREERAYSDLVLPSSSWKLAAAITVAPTSGVLNVFAFGGDF